MVAVVRLLVIYFMISLSFNLYGYEVETHQKLSVTVADRLWKDKNNTIIDDFNIKYSTKFFGKLLIEHIRDGAKFEDNNYRPLNHFYDPQNDIGLSDGLTQGYNSPDWALEDNELVDLPEQQYSLLDASDYLYQALSIQDSKERETNFGKLFRTLGQVIHHVQDMAQPQHVRNDPHCGEPFCKKLEFLGVFNPSLYEELSNKERNSLPFTGYGNISYLTARDFWHNSNWTGMADFTNQNFISIGTNFIANNDGSFSTIADYPEPKPFPEISYDKLLFTEISVELPDSNLSGLMAFMPSLVTDKNFTGTSATVKNNYASTLSIFDQDLELDNACVQYTRKLHNGETKTYTYETCALFTYNRFNVEAAQKFLIPRAVAYSTGLINYFFRGRLDVTKSEQTADTSGNAIVAITIKNTSAQNFHMSNGKLEFFYDAIVDGEDVRKPVQRAQGETGNITELRNGTETTFKIILPTDIDTDKENPFIVVYKGVIGEEPGVAGKVFNIKEETAILLFYQKDSNNISLKRSIDKGKSWIYINDPMLEGFNLFNGSHKGTQLLPSNSGSGLLVGSYRNGYVVLRTLDNGKTWNSFLEQNSGEYTEIINIAQAVHVGGGRLITFNNHFSDSFTVGYRTYYSYDTELSQSFDDGQTWSPISLPFTIKGGGASHLYYLGNNHLYLLVAEYDFTCDCTKRVLYESFNLGESFSKISFTVSELEWNYGQWYRDAYAFDTGEIITTKNLSTSLNFEAYSFGISNDGGRSLNITDKAAKDAGWLQAEPINIRPTGQGEYVSYVFDPWTAYAQGLSSYYEGILVSEDRGLTWTEVYAGNVPTWDYPYFLMMGVLTKDANNLKYIH